MGKRPNQFVVEQVGATFTATDGDDRVRVINSYDVTVYGGAGNDRIEDNNADARGGNRYFGGEGKDILYGAAPNSWLNGGAGHDTLYSTSEFGPTGSANFVFGPADDSSRDNVFGRPGDKYWFNAADYGLTEGHGLIDGQLDPEYFQRGTKVTADHAVFFFNEATNTLTWDPDGRGGEARIAIAKLIQPDATFDFDQIHIATDTMLI